MVAQGRPFVLSAKHAAPLKLGHYLGREVEEAVWHIREHDVEPVGPALPVWMKIGRMKAPR